MPQPQLRTSLITSFTLEGAAASLQSWPRGLSYGELYAFVQRDADDVLTHYSGINGSALEHMAALASRSDRTVDRLARKLAGQFADAGVQLIALATFFPEITSRSDPKAAIRARDALVFLVRLARRINRAGKGAHRIQTIELVAGSLIHTIRPLLGGDSHAYQAEVGDWREALDTLCHNLRPAAREALAAGADAGGQPIRLALEKEPGELYVLGRWERLETLCRLLEHQYRELSPVIGFNLDIPHWAFLCSDHAGGILRRLQRRDQPSPIFRRIVHAHVSDHAKGHFGDNAIGAIHPLERFQPWFHLLRRRLREAAASPDARRPGFSGFVSVELEACKDEHTVRSCIEKCRLLTGEKEPQLVKLAAGRETRTRHDAQA